MATVKTDISLSKSLLEEVETVAREMKVSRSRLFVMAVKDFIRRYQNQRLVEQINQAYQDGPDKEEQELLEHMLPLYREVIEEDEYIGTLSPKRIRQILDGIRLITEPREVE